jgi:phenylpyruvate tautomerase PptA (4-oxalocrotonate tautomerase family)
MPFIRVTVSGPTLAPKQVVLLHTEITQLMASVLGKRADLTSVLGSELNPVTYIVVNEVPANAWGYDGRSQESRLAAV